MDIHPSKRIIIYCLVWTILSFLVVYFYEVSISPRYDIYYGDCSVFKTIAYAWIDGRIPYRDIFDHKGPLLYVINVIGLLISEKWGLLLLSAINLSITTITLWGLGNLWLSYKQSSFCVCLFLCCYICVNNGGDMTESWSLPFCVLPIYLFSKDTQTESYTWRHSIIYGFCFGIIALIRINNGIIPASIVLTMLIMLIKEGSIRQAFYHVGLVLIGLLLVVIPMISYFYHTGALQEMIFANYIFNIEYMLKWTFIVNNSRTISRILSNLEWIFPLTILMIWSIYDIFRYKKAIAIAMMLTISCGVTIIANISGMAYLHYYITFLPLIFILSIKVCGLIRHNAKMNSFSLAASVIFGMWCVTILLPSLYGWTLQLGKDVYKYGIIRTPDSNEANSTMQLILNNIPKNQMKEIYNFGTYEGIAALLMNNVIPTGKYFYLQPKLFKVSDIVATEIDKYHNNAAPEYILTDKASIGSDGCPSFNTMLSRYQIVDSTHNSIYLFKLQDPAYE